MTGAAEVPPSGGRELVRADQPDGSRPVVVLLGGGVPAAVLLQRIRGLRHAHVHVIAPQEELAEIDFLHRDARPWAAADLAQVDRCLRMIGSPDRLYCLSPGSFRWHRNAWERLFPHVRHGGRYVVPWDACATREDFARWSAYALRLKRCALNPAARSTLSAGSARLASAVGDLVVTGDAVELGMARSLVLKVREQYATRLIRSRMRRSHVEELCMRPATRFECRGRTFSHASAAEITNIEAQLEVPELRVRAYSGDVRVVERCLALVEDVVIPESFRFPLQEQLQNPRLRDLDPTWAEVKGLENYSWDRLPGTYYHLDSSNSGHFGHLMTEVLSKVWGWEIAQQHEPGVKALFRIRSPGERFPGLELAVLEACGIPRTDVVWVAAPVRVDELISASPQWNNNAPHYVDPRIAQVWERMRASLVDRSAETPELLFVSRRLHRKNRTCRNSAQVEHFFRSRGFFVVYPEDLSLSEQATLFAGARVIAGFGGSGLFNSLFAERLEALIVLSQEAYTARNEHLFGAVLGCDVHYFWSTPDIPHPPDGWTEEAYYSAWEFDFERNRGDLERTLDGYAA